MRGQMRQGVSVKRLRRGGIRNRIYYDTIVFEIEYGLQRAENKLMANSTWGGNT